MRKSVSAAWVIAVALAVLVTPALGEARSYTVFRAKAPPRLDGRFDDDYWRGVPWQTGFTFLGGGEVGARFQTQFAMLWDDQCLCVAVRALEPEMSGLVARAPRGSNDVFRDDRIEIVLCSDPDRSNWRQFVVNPAGRALDFTYAEKKIAGRQVMPDAAPWRCACASGTVCWQVALAIPLSELKIEPREGAVFAGNVARTRAVEQPEQYRTTWAPLAKEFDESESFGTLRLAGSPPPEAAVRSLAVDQNSDRVTTVPGDRLTGTVLGLGEDGWLRIRCPEFPTEVRVRASALDRVELPYASPPGTGARIALANGDFILGEVRSIGPERTVVVNDAFGELTFPMPLLSEVRIGAAARSFLDTRFDAGEMDPWMVVRGKWAVEKGRLVSPVTAPEGAAIAAALPQDGPITFEADLEAMGEERICCDMILFAGQSGRPSVRTLVRDQPDGPSRRSVVVLNFQGNGEGTVGIGNWPPVGNEDWSGPLHFALKTAPNVRLRLSYDPKDGTVRAWQDEQMLGPFRGHDEGRPKDGRYVVFVAFSPVAIKRLRVLPGVVPPGGEPKAESGSVSITLTNGDTMTAQSVTFADGRFTIKTGYGETRTEPGQVASLQFAGQGDKPVADEAAVRVVTSEGRLTLRSCTLTADRLAGQSEIYGAVAIPRDRVRSIQFLRAAP
jgi:hypothetical protein